MSNHPIETEGSLGFLQVDLKRTQVQQHKALALKTNVRFPFDIILFAHIPKTGGTAMRPALNALSQARGQQLQVCYNDLHCSAPVNDELTSIEGTTRFASHDPHPTSQIVFGHGLKAKFQHTWGLDNAHVAHIRVFREPVLLLLSAWHHQAREPAWQNFNMTIDEWIEQGKAEAFADFFLSYFVEMDVEDPWDQWMRADRPSSGIQASNMNQYWKDKVDAAIGSGDSLVLKHGDWSKGMGRLRTFLNLTNSEHNALFKASQRQRNVDPRKTKLSEYLVKESNYHRLRKSTELLSYMYDRLGFTDGKKKTAASLISFCRTCKRSMHLTLHLDHHGDVESYALRRH